jgi:hypothetical protein
MSVKTTQEELSSEVMVRQAYAMARRRYISATWKRLPEKVAPSGMGHTGDHESMHRVINRIAEEFPWLVR